MERGCIVLAEVSSILWLCEEWRREWRHLWLKLDFLDLAEDWFIE